MGRYEEVRYDRWGSSDFFFCVYALRFSAILHLWQGTIKKRHKKRESLFCMTLIL